MKFRKRKLSRKEKGHVTYERMSQQGHYKASYLPNKTQLTPRPHYIRGSHNSEGRVHVKDIYTSKRGTVLLP